MHRWLPLLVAFLGPGVAQALTGRRRTAAIFVAAGAAALAGTIFTIYAIVLLVVVMLASFLDALVYAIRERHPESQPIAAVVTGAIAAAFAIVAGALLVQAFKIPSSAMMPTLEIGDHIIIDKLARSPARGDIIVFRHPCHPERDYIKRVVALANDSVEVRCGVLYVNGKEAPLKLVAAEQTYVEHMLEGETFQRAASRYRETLEGRTYDVFHDVDRPRGTVLREAGDFPRERLENCSNQPIPGPPSEQQPGKLVETAAADDSCKPHRHFVVPAGHVFTLGDHRNNSNDSRFWGSVPASHIHGTVTGIYLPVRRFGTVD